MRRRGEEREKEGMKGRSGMTFMRGGDRLERKRGWRGVLMRIPILFMAATQTNNLKKFIFFSD